MKRPGWMDGPLFDLKPGVIHAWAWMMLIVVGCTVSVAAKGDLWLVAAMAPGVLLSLTNQFFTDPRYKKEATNE